MSGSKWDAPVIRAALVEVALQSIQDGRPFPKGECLALMFSRHHSQMARHVKVLEDTGRLKFRRNRKQRYVVAVQQ
jgi:hypothetical protein